MTFPYGCLIQITCDPYVVLTMKVQFICGSCVVSIVHNFAFQVLVQLELGVHVIKLAD